MIVDAVMVRDELDLLEARLIEFDDVVDRWVIVEGECRFGDGARKPLWFAEHRERFAAWADRIVHLVVTADEFPDDPWGREDVQRQRLFDGFADVPPSATVLVGDVDEFPARELVRPGVAGTFAMRHMVYAPNLEHPQPWAGTVAGDASSMSEPHRVRRDRRSGALFGGFHFSWHPGEEPIAAKVKASAHTEYASLPAEDGKAQRRTHWDSVPLQVVEVDGSWPRWFRDGSCPDWWWA